MMIFQTELSQDDKDKLNLGAYYLTLAVAIIFAIVMAIVENYLF